MAENFLTVKFWGSHHTSKHMYTEEFEMTYRLKLVKLFKLETSQPQSFWCRWPNLQSLAYMLIACNYWKMLLFFNGFFWEFCTSPIIKCVLYPIKYTFYQISVSIENRFYQIEKKELQCLVRGILFSIKFLHNW